MKITSLNLQGFTDWEERSMAIQDYLRSTNPDVVLFQEVVFLPDISSVSQANMLARELDYKYRHESITRLQKSPQHRHYREGLTVLSRHPIISTETIVLKKEDGDEHNRLVQLIDIEVEGQIHKLANVHFSITDVTDFATVHLAETLGILDARGEERIVAGDFNMNDLDYSADLWSDKYRSSSEVDYISFPEKNKRIDYFLIPKTYEFDSLSISGDGLSDHRAITAAIA